MAWINPDDAKDGYVYLAWVIGDVPGYWLLAKNGGLWEDEQGETYEETPHVIPRAFIAGVHELPRPAGCVWGGQPAGNPIAELLALAAHQK